MTMPKRSRLKSIRMWLGLRPVSGLPYIVGAFCFLILLMLGDGMLSGSPSPLDELLGGSMIAIGFVGFAVVSFVGCAENRTKPKHPAGHCQTCGYNLTGNVSGICPECGEAVNKAEVQTT